MIVPKSLEEIKSGVLREEEDIEAPSPDYKSEELQYLSGIRKRLMRAKQQRDQNHEAFDGMSYVERCVQNRRLANSYIRPRDNRQETNFTTGLSRQKLMTQLATLINLNLEPDITAYNEENYVMAEMGEGLEDILEKNRELDNDEEKQIRRQQTLIEQGEVFVEVLWKKFYYLKKTLKNAFTGKFRNVSISRKLRRALARLQTNIIKNEKVYLGNITCFDIEDQPFIYTIDVKPIDEVEPIFKKWEMWKFVSNSYRHFDATTAELDRDGYSSFWSITNIKKGFVEIVKYQSKPHNEFQIFLNGIPMLPIGYPLSEISPNGEYNIVKQVLEIINEHFAYGKSLMQRLKTSAALEDEFWKLAILKGQQGFQPPMVNNTGRILSSRMFMPGVITNNIPDGKLKPLLENMSGLTTSDAQILGMLRDNLEDQSTDPQVSGRQPEGDPTATEILKTQAQAEKMLGLTIVTAAMLEKKIAQLSLSFLLKYWFDPVDNKIDKVKGALVGQYRRVNVPKPISGQGMGQEIVEVADNKTMPTSFDVFQENRRLSKETGIPTRKIVLNRDHIRNAKYNWRVAVVPQPKRTTNLQKLMFRDKVGIYTQSPNFNLDWFEEKAAITWGDNPQEVFKRMPAGREGVANNMMLPPEKGEGGAGQVAEKRTPAGKLFQQEGISQ